MMNFSQMFPAWISTCVWFPLELRLIYPLEIIQTSSEVPQNRIDLPLTYILSNCFTVFPPLDSEKRLKDVLKQFRDGEFSQYKPEEVSFATTFF